jgi:purine-binding chemotaxis protein CheW
MAELLDQQEIGPSDSLAEALADPLGEMLSDLLEIAGDSPDVGNLEMMSPPEDAESFACAGGPVEVDVGLAPPEIAEIDDVGGVTMAYPWEDPEPPDAGMAPIVCAADVEESGVQPDTSPLDFAPPAPVTEPVAAEPIDVLPVPAIPASNLVTEPVAAKPIDVSPLEPLPAVAAAEAAPVHALAPAPSEPAGEEEPAASIEPADSNALDALVSTIDYETGWTSSGEFDLEEEAPSKVRVLQNCIVFLLGATRYGIPIRNVLEMDAMPRITVVPNVPAFVRGVTNLRGEIVAVLDLRTLLGLDRADSGERGRILIVRTSDQQTAALAVDEVRGTTELSLADLVQPASPIHGKVSSVLLGVGDHQKQVLNVLDVDKLFGTPELRQLAMN